MPIRRALFVYLAVVCMACLAAALRLRTLDASGLPLSALLPFVYPLLGAVSEMTLLMGVPSSVLCGLAAGLSARVAAIFGLLALALTCAVSALAEASAQSPGTLAQELVDVARERCLRSEQRREEVPIVPLTWSCALGRAATLSGRGAWTQKLKVEASNIELAADLREARLERVDARITPRSPLPALHLQVARVRVRGLPPWGRPANLSFAFRLALGGVAAALTLLVGVLALRRSRVPSWLTLAFAILAGAVVLALELWLDRRSSPIGSYVLAAVASPISCGITLFGLDWLLRRRSLIAQPRS